MVLIVQSLLFVTLLEIVSVFWRIYMVKKIDISNIMLRFQIQAIKAFWGRAFL